jgi:hypothetical protein
MGVFLEYLGAPCARIPGKLLKKKEDKRKADLEAEKIKVSKTKAETVN